MSKIIEQKDLVTAGFERLDENLIEKNSPKISWGMIYQNWSLEEQRDYAEKLAATMNHAAFLIQRERNELNIMLRLKEDQLVRQSKGMNSNNDMLQIEITKMNEERQQWNAEAIRLKSIIKELQNGNQH